MGEARGYTKTAQVKGANQLVEAHKAETRLALRVRDRLDIPNTSPCLPNWNRTAHAVDKSKTTGGLACRPACLPARWYLFLWPTPHG